MIKLLLPIADKNKHFAAFVFIAALTACSSPSSVSPTPQQGNGEAPPLSAGRASAVAGPFRVTFSGSGPSMKSTRLAVNENESMYRPDIDLGRLHLSPVVIRPNEASSEVEESALAGGFAVQPALAANAVFNETGQIDISGSTNGTYITTVSGTGDVDVWSFGGSLVKSTSTSSLFCGSNKLPACAASPFIVDQRVIFDAAYRRWIISALPIAHTYHTPVFLAISENADPTGFYNLYQVASCGPNYTGDTDQPRVGYSARWLVLSVPCFAGYPSVTAMNKANIYSGGILRQNTTYWQFVDPVNVGGGNRDQPVLTYAPTLNREYLVASVINRGAAAALYSYVDGPVNAPKFYAGTHQVTTSFGATGPVPIDAPGCQGCMSTFTNGWVHSAGVWPLKNGQLCVVSTAVLADTRFARSTQAVQVVFDATANSAVAFRLAGGASGNGLLGSETAMPLISNKLYDAALVEYSYSSATFYPGARLAEWNIDTNRLVSAITLRQGRLTPTGFDASRWLDFMIGIAPIPGSTRLVASGPVAATFPGDVDTEKLVLWNTITP